MAFTSCCQSYSYGFVRSCVASCVRVCRSLLFDGDTVKALVLANCWGATLTFVGVVPCMQLN